MPSISRPLVMRATGLVMHFMLFCVLSAFIVIMSTWLYMQPLLPKLKTLDDYVLEVPLHVYSRDGDLIGEFGEKRRIPISYEETPQDLVKAFLAAEDDRFFSHGGVDIKSILRAFIELVMSGSIQSGGSTITMQVARNYLLTADRTLIRKMKEILLALKIEQRFSKEKILELYVNKIFLGKRAYGAEAAARVYYGKSLSELNLAQYAMIASLPKAPSAYNPLVNPERAINRRNWILQRMLGLGHINEKNYQEALAQGISATRHSTFIGVDAEHAAEWARQIVVDEMYGLAAYTKGYKVYTTIRSDWQRNARNSVSAGMFEYDWRHGWRGIKNRMLIDDSTMTVRIGDDILRLPSEEGDFPDVVMSYEASAGGKIASIGIGTSAPSYFVPILSEKKSSKKDAPSQGLVSAHMLASEALINSWRTQLKALPKYNNLLPAAVLAIDWRNVQILLADGSMQEIEWKHGISQAKRFITEDIVGLAPLSAFDIMGIGDVLYVRRYKGKYHLRQVPEVRAALVAVDPKNGAVRALVSGFDFQSDKFNNVIQSKRQPGSGIKPFIYTKALEKGYTAASLFNDAPLVFKEDDALEDVWHPSNAGDIFRGPTRMRIALVHSINLASIRVLRKIGINSAVSSLRRFGFNMRGARRDLSLVLGSQSVKPIDMARAYSVFANGGYLIEPYIIERIENAQGQVVYQSQSKRVPELECHASTEQECSQYRILQYGLPFDEESSNIAPRVIDERVNYIMNDMLRDVIQRGTARRARVLGRTDIAGKTGTTNGPTDAWFSGYHPNLTTIVWFGFSDNRFMGEREYGGSIALPVWINFMRETLANEPEHQLSQPDGISVVRIDPVTGELALSTQQDDDLEIFRNEHIPKRKWNTGNATQDNTDFDSESIRQEDDDTRSVDELF